MAGGHRVVGIGARGRRVCPIPGTSPSVLGSLERLVLLVENEGGETRSQHRGSKVDDPVNLEQKVQEKKKRMSKVKRVANGHV